MRLFNSIITFLLLALTFNNCIAQSDRWQQHINYNISVSLDTATNQLSGTEKIIYTNNSPDTLHRLFLHLYWNAFQPNSSMDVRSRELGKILVRNRRGDEVPDWDGRVKDRILHLNPKEIGFNQIKALTINGKEQTLIPHETIVEVVLAKPILPHTNTNIDLEFQAQVPVQIRRSGRNNAEGICYSMSQWYPKMVEYDYQGWNANPYIAREFYGVWGDYNVTITLPKNYMVAATGTLINANEIGYGYSPNPIIAKPNSNGNLTWHFEGKNIHDFVWAADTTYKHLSVQYRKGLTIHVFYKPSTPTNDSAWANVLWTASKILPFIENRYGAYPYPQYSFIQGGDGGMEYAMATLIKGSGISSFAHEWMHNWYQQLLGTNESLYPWMDEGFTQFATEEVEAYYYSNWASKSPYKTQKDIAEIEKMNNYYSNSLPKLQSSNYAAYFFLAKSGLEEPLTTHADHFNANFAYSNASYCKGAVFLNQINYLIGDSLFNVMLHNYYNEWRFKHPNPNDFIRVCEKTSGFTLQWYKEYFVNSTKTIDYAIGNIFLDSITQQTTLLLKRIGKMPMPLDVLITYKDGSKELHYIPLNLMYGNKPAENNVSKTTHPEWRWTHPEYTFPINHPINAIKSIEIDPTQRMADINRTNNKLVIPD